MSTPTPTPETDAAKVQASTGFGVDDYSDFYVPEETAASLERRLIEMNESRDSYRAAFYDTNRKLTESQAACAAMREAINGQPHEEFCHSIGWKGFHAECNCWKSKALQPTAGAELLAEVAKGRDWLDTLRAIYERLGIKEGDAPGDEKVSVTVKRYVDEIAAKLQAERELADRLAELAQTVCISSDQLAEKFDKTDKVLAEWREARK